MINKSYTKTYASVSNEKSPLMVTRVLSNNLQYKERELPPSPPKTLTRRKTIAIAKPFALEANAIIKLKLVYILKSNFLNIVIS